MNELMAKPTGDVAIDYLQGIGKLIAGAQAGHTL